MSDTIISFEDVDFAYDRDLVLAGVNFSVAAGEFVSIVGPNGGGKTTLFKLILGLLRPTRGTVRVFGDAPGRHKRRIGYVPQFEKFDSAFPVSALDVVLLGRIDSHFWGWASAADRAAAMAALERLNLGGVAGQPFAALSGGQKQRVLIARALSTDAELLLLDEPTANIDRRAEQEFYDILRQLNRTHTILVISHNIEMVSQAVRRVICVHRSVSAHETAALDNALFQQVFGTGLRLIKHDHDCENCRRKTAMPAPRG
ncbi:MAG: ABC transporter ATP-binding protein [Planctomycetes bacterium]|nr:ABC transporter ATP-binding protein [Planctomycetota bacterium]